MTTLNTPKRPVQTPEPPPAASEVVLRVLRSLGVGVGAAFACGLALVVVLLALVLVGAYGFGNYERFVAWVPSWILVVPPAFGCVASAAAWFWLSSDR